MKSISIAIPTYECHGKGAELLEYSFNMLAQQTYKDFDVTISDDSTDNGILNLCKKWDTKLDIKYHKNAIRGAASNTENAVRRSIGKYIKILCMDDLLYAENSLQIIADSLNESTDWLFSAYVHSYDRINIFKYHLPIFNHRIAIHNTLGTPSGLTIKNREDLPVWDNYLTYYYDCDFYYRMYRKFGYPKVIPDVTMINYLSNDSVTSGVSQDLVNREVGYIIKKYGLT